MAADKSFSNEFLKYALVSALSGNTVKVALCGDGLALDDTDQYLSGATLDEISPTSGYSGGHGNSGRKSLTMSFSADNTDDEGVMDATNLTWTPGTGATIHYAVYHIAGATGDTDAVYIGKVGVGGTTGQVTNGGQIELEFDTEGLINFGRASGS